ncbi:hypothetical protein TNCT_94301 [Trichonephila clavata]|uniref:Uncharacterized protein n=1 Tax=Trichonephila clavata TaxID=2740835 RepID=A0A8X6K957_TRICU|nr:hypothetical protein TNCT_94301 [Trichonephila clavata]
MTSIEEPGSQVDDQSVTMEDVSTATLTDEERCSKLSGLETQIQIFDAMKNYVLKMIEIDKKYLSPLPETMPQLESELKNLEDKINFQEDVPVENELNQIKTTNSFAALSTAKSDAEDVTPAPSKVKPIMMRMTTLQLNPTRTAPKIPYCH